jgi:hypothetical protein
MMIPSNMAIDFDPSPFVTPWFTFTGLFRHTARYPAFQNILFFRVASYDG